MHAYAGIASRVFVVVRSCRFDYHPQQYVAGVMEEDDPSHASRPLIGSPVDAGRSFTLYLYDREKHHVSRGWCSGCWVMCHVCVIACVAAVDEGLWGARL